MIWTYCKSKWWEALKEDLKLKVKEHPRERQNQSSNNRLGKVSTDRRT
jgi:hypothetical protein